MRAPTTLEMDGLFSEEDIANRHFVIRQCDDCNLFSKWDIRSKNTYACAHCGSSKYDVRTQHSIRTHGAANTRRKGRKKLK